MKVTHQLQLPCLLKKPFDLELPINFELLTVQVVKGMPKMWGIAEENEKRTVKRRFRIYSNLEPIDEGSLIYIGTIVVSDGKAALHLFEIDTSKPDLLVVK